MVPKPSARGWAKWLDGKVQHLRSQLALSAPDNWESANFHCSGYRLSSIQLAEPTPAGFAIEAELMRWTDSPGGLLKRDGPPKLLFH